MQLPTQDAPQSALKLLQQSFSPAHHESQKQPLGACKKQIPEHSPAAADRTRAMAIERTARVMVIALPRYPRDLLSLVPHVTISRCWCRLWPTRRSKERVKPSVSFRSAAARVLWPTLHVYPRVGGGESGHGMAHGLVLVGCCALLLAALPPTPVEHTPPCADSSPACANWAKQGECKANPG